MRALITLGLMCAFVAPAAAADDALLQALQAEVIRSAEQLALPDAEGPYFVAYTLYDTTTAYAEGSFGGLLRSGLSHKRPLRAEVRVGSYNTDNANFNSFGQDPGGIASASLVLDDDVVAIQRDLWVVTDEAYKSAVAGLSHKLAARAQSRQEDHAPDYAPAPLVVEVGADAAATPDRELMETLARNLSALVCDFPAVEHSRVYATDVGWRRYLVNSEGSAIVDHGRMTVVRAVAEARTADGTLVKDFRSWLAPSPAGLPSAEAMGQQLQQMLRGLDTIAAADTVDDYLGPVIFEGQAAAELFRQLMVPQLMGTPAEESDGAWDAGAPRSLGRLGRRVLPADFVVWDDPSGAPDGSIGAYRFDHEGVAARRVELVSNGVVQDLLMSRTPREDVDRSNGHGRGGTNTRMVGMPGVMTVEQKGALSDRKLMQQAFRMARQSGSDHVLVVRLLDDPSLRSAATVRRIRFGEDDRPALTAPLEVIRRYADGRPDEVVRGASFLVADHRVLRDIVGTSSARVSHDYLAPPVLHGGTQWVTGPTSGIPVTLRTPATVLVSEMEVGEGGGGGTPEPLLPTPLAGP
jgi:TldD protein